MKYLTISLLLAGGFVALSTMEASAVVCARGVYRAGCVAAGGAAVVARPVDLAPCVRVDIQRRSGWGGCSAFAVGRASASGLQGHCKNGNRPDWHLSSTCAWSVNRVRETFLRSENQPG